MNASCGVIAAVAIAAFGAVPAQAGTVALRQTGPATGNYDLFYEAGAGETNRVKVTRVDTRTLRVEEPAAPLTPGENCMQASDGSVTCEPPVPYGFLGDAHVDLADGDDSLSLHGIGGFLALGPGDDAAEADLAITVGGGPGADLMRGGAYSSVTYADRSEPVTVTLDGVGNDGAAGEGDDVGRNFWRVTGGAGDDELHGSPIGPTKLHGLGGDDRLHGGPFGEHYSGDTPFAPPPDLVGGDGDDVLVGGTGDDALVPGPGADVVRGGGGTDAIDYRGAAAVDVTLDDRPGDGPPGEHDDIGADVEVLTGSDGPDRLVGSAGPNLIDAGAGDDVVDGGGGRDRLVGENGDDRLDGGADQDVLVTGGGDGRVGYEDDTAVGGPGRDRFIAYSGSSIAALDGERDAVACGARVVLLSADPFESLRRCAPEVFGSRGDRFRARTKSVSLMLKCAQGTDIPCVGKLVLRDPGRGGLRDRAAPVVALARFRLPVQGHPARVRARLTRYGRARIERAGALRVAAWITTLRRVPRSSREEVWELELLAPR